MTLRKNSPILYSYRKYCFSLLYDTEGGAARRQKERKYGMKVNIGTYSFGGIASFLDLGPSLLDKFKLAASLGYTGIELLGGDLDHKTEDMLAWAKEAGVQIVSVHAMPSREIIEKMAALGAKAVICAGTAFCSEEEAKEVAEEFEEYARIAQPYGIKIGYHNHSQEFYMDGGKSLLEHLLDNAPHVYSQLDCGWAMNAGMYPPYFIRKYKDRIVSIHVKENNKVHGPGPRPRSRHAEGALRGTPFAGAKLLPLAERQKMYDDYLAHVNPRNPEFACQCKIADETSNIDWKEIKKALDEQSFEAFWVVEREYFYTDHDECLREDCAWLMENIK